MVASDPAETVPVAVNLMGASSATVVTPGLAASRETELART
jgi:hypothetical protein